MAKQCNKLNIIRGKCIKESGDGVNISYHLVLLRVRKLLDWARGASNSGVIRYGTGESVIRLTDLTLH